MSATFARFNFGRFQFWSLSILVAFNFGSFSVFCLSSELCFTIKTQKKKRKNFPLSVFRKVIHICLSFVFRCQILSLICVGTLASSLLSFLLNLLVDVGCVFSTELYTLTFPRYTRFGPKVALFFGLAKTSKYKPIFSLNQLPKSLVACVRVCSDTFEKHESSSAPIFRSNVGNFSTFQFR
jgi:hypothetical protein